MAQERKLRNPTNPDSPIEVFAVDEKGPGGAHHEYEIRNRETGEVLETISLQKGGIAKNGVNGATNEALLMVVIDRADCFDKGPFRSRPNSVAKTHAETSLLWFDYRTAERRERGVEGKEVE